MQQSSNQNKTSTYNSIYKLNKNLEVCMKYYALLHVLNKFTHENYSRHGVKHLMHLCASTA